MPNLRGASPVGRGDEGHSCAARWSAGEESGVSLEEELSFGGAEVDP